jgi:hypothetical protein
VAAALGFDFSASASILRHEFTLEGCDLVFETKDAAHSFEV